MINCIIVDDEMPAREELKFLLKSFDEIRIIGEADNGIDALDKITNLNPDIVFLDIQMPQISGIKVAQELIKEKNAPLIIFVTAYDEFAVKAFEVNAVDYLLKPVSEDRIKRTIDKISKIYKKDKISYSNKLQDVLRMLQAEDYDRVTIISVSKSDKIIPLNLDEIIYATLEDRDTIIFSTKGKFLYNDTLTHLSSKLKSNNFFRCHRSYIINLKYIKEIEPWFNSTYQIRLENTKELIPVSRNKVRDFKRIMNIT